MAFLVRFPRHPVKTGPQLGEEDINDACHLHNYNRSLVLNRWLDNKDNFSLLHPGCRNGRQQDNRDSTIPQSTTQEEIRPVF
jgi:hypothetical protein